MKKTLLFILGMAGSFAFAQAPITVDFSTYAVGNIGTDITGMTPGQGNWLTLASNGTAPTTTTNANNDNFQVVNAGGTNGNVLQINGPNGDKGSKVMWQDGLDTWWAVRPVGSNIIEGEYSFFTGPATASLNNMRVLFYDATGTKILAGLSFVESTKIISGVAYYDNSANPGGSVTNYLFTLGTAPVVLPANTWVRMGMSFNYTTGEVKWKGPGFNGFVMGAAATNNPAEADVVATAGTGNTVSSTGLFDDFVVRASATDTLLGLGAVAAVQEFSIYPNPANDFVTITGSANMSLKKVAITDLNGRIIKQQVVGDVSETTVNISDLSAGVYLVSVSGENGTVTRKIIKN